MILVWPSAAAVVLKNSQEVEEKLEAAKGDLSKQLEVRARNAASVKAQFLMMPVAIL